MPADNLEPDDDDPCEVLSGEAAKRVIAAAQRGHGLASWKQLSSSGLAPQTAATWECFKQKVRPTDAAPLPSTENTNLEWLPGDDAWAAAIRRLKPNKGADPGGWTHEAWQFIWEEPSLQQALTSWLRNLCMETANTERLQCIHTYRAVCLTKPSGGVRPIVLSSLMRKLICGAFVPAVKAQLTPHFQHVQYGAATPDGCLHMYAHLASLLEADESTCLLQTDIQQCILPP